MIEVDGAENRASRLLDHIGGIIPPPKPDLEDEEVVFNIRCLYGFSQSLVFGALLYIRYRGATRPSPAPPPAFSALLPAFPARTSRLCVGQVVS